MKVKKSHVRQHTCLRSRLILLITYYNLFLHTHTHTHTDTHTHQVSHDMHWYWWFFLNQLHKYDWVVTGGSPKISPLCWGRAWGAPKEKNPESIEALKWNLEPPCDGSKWVELTGRRPICGTFCTWSWHFIRPSTENKREILWCYVYVFVLKRDTDLTPPNHQHHQENI